MRQLKLLAIALMAIASVGVGLTSAAQAVELKGLPEGAKFIFKSTGKIEVENLILTKLECLSVTGAGELNSERLGKIELKLMDCLEPLTKIKCTGLGDTTGNITVKGEFHLRHLLSTASEWVDLVLLLNVTHFSCNLVLETMEGCVASDDLLAENSNAVGKLVATINANFLVAVKEGKRTGDPAVESIDTDNSLSMEKCILLTKEGTSSATSAAVQAAGVIEKCELVLMSCTFLIDLTGAQ